MHGDAQRTEANDGEIPQHATGKTVGELQHFGVHNANRPCGHGVQGQHCRSINQSDGAEADKRDAYV